MFQLVHVAGQFGVQTLDHGFGLLALGDVGAEHVIADHLPLGVALGRVVDHLPDAREGLPVVGLGVTLEGQFDAGGGRGVAFPKDVAHRAAGDVGVLGGEILPVLVVHIDVALPGIDEGDQGGNVVDHVAQPVLAFVELFGALAHPLFE